MVELVARSANIRVPWASPPAFLGSNNRGFEPYITATTGRRAWPRELLDWVSSNFSQGII